MIAGDEGSAYGLGRAALASALRSSDGRGAQTALLPQLLEALGLANPDAIPSWAGRAQKGEIAGLAVVVVRVADEGDEVATELVRREAAALVEHASALIRRLGPWEGPTPVVVHGGLARLPAYGAAVEGWLREAQLPFRIVAAAADAVTGALRIAGAREPRGRVAPREQA